ERARPDLALRRGRWLDVDARAGKRGPGAAAPAVERISFQWIEIRSTSLCLAHVLIGEPAATSPAYALVSADAVAPPAGQESADRQDLHGHHGDKERRRRMWTDVAPVRRELADQAKSSGRE